ncbi:MAG: hypothetical protein PHS41_10760 [Victivallaceae bacterium]|nr:hypothetical protein [Victivallaceae bacterium]
MKKIFCVILVVVALLLTFAGCVGAYQSQTTVLGMELAYNPTQSVTPSVRLGVITHRQNVAAKDALRRMHNQIRMYDVSLWTGSGTVEGLLKIQ